MAEKKETAEKTVKNELPARVPVFIPKENKNDEDLFVSINGRRYLLQKGVQVMVPPEVKEVIDNMFKARNEADAYILANEKE